MGLKHKDIFIRVTQLFVFSLLFSGVGLDLSFKEPGAFLSYPNLMFLIFLSVSLFCFVNEGGLKPTVVLTLLLIFVLWAISGAYVAMDIKEYLKFYLAFGRGVAFVFFVNVLLQKYPSAVNRVINSFCLMCVCGAIFAIIQEIVFLAAGVPLWGADTRQNLVTFMSVNFLRVTSFMSDPNVFGVYMAVGLVGIAIKVMFKRPRISWVLIMGFGTILAALFLTFSRGAFLGIVMFLFLCISIALTRVVILGKVSLFKMLLMTTAFCTTFLMGKYVFDRRALGDISIGKRFFALKEFGEIFTKSPILGAGLGNISMHSVYGQTSHNLLLEVFGSTGIVGGAIFIGILIFTYRETAVIKKVFPKEGMILQGFFLSILIVGIFLSLLSNVLLWVIIGLIDVLYNTCRSEISEYSPYCVDPAGGSS